VVEIEIGYNRTFLLRMPTFLPLPANSTGGFVRSFNDTCGLFDISYAASSKAGSGPPPHVHYGDDEWFIQAGSGKVRMYTHQKAVQLTPGQLPGFNAPPVKMGSAVLTTGQALYSPRGSVHYFARETDTTDFYAIHVSGYAMPLIIDAFNSDRNATELLYYTGLYGAPHDMTGRFVGMGDCGDECYRTTVGPVDVGDLQLQRLQGLFDIAEERGCWTG
jgi:mannose-6-phosphate isomerase-like protein (cupin superfamily)